MKKVLLSLLFAAAVLGLMLPTAAFASGTVNVTFIVNTSSVPDTVNSATAVSLHGATQLGDTVFNGWGNTVSMTNIGGDYWSVTVPMTISDTLHYKIVIYSAGWEENIEDAFANGNRNFIVPATDTTVQVQYWNNGHFPSGKQISDDFAVPYEDTGSDSIDVYFRVNIKAIKDNALYGWSDADADSVCLLGGGPNGSNLSWSTPLYLTQESAPTNSSTSFVIAPTTFYHGTIHIPKDSATAGDTIYYKYRLGSQWTIGSTNRSEQFKSSDTTVKDNNRFFVIPSTKTDTTIHWVYFGNTKPGTRANTDTVTATFRVDMTTSIDNGGFATGDTLQLQVGWFSTADSTRTIQMSRIGTSYIYRAQVTMLTALQKNLDYQYYVVKNGSSNRENFYNFDYNGDTQSEAERRMVYPSSNTISVWDTVSSVTSMRRQPYFASLENFSQTVKVTWTVDLRPAYYTVNGGYKIVDSQGGTPDISVADSITSYGVGINGGATYVYDLNTWASWAQTLVADTSGRKMYDDGTHGDAIAGDTIYTRQYTYTTDYVKGLVYKFGINGGDNEPGNGTGYGNNHLANVSDADTVYTVATDFGSINPSYFLWDYDLHVPKQPNGVASVSTTAKTYALQQNYPNPFNPSTKIQFSIPKQSNVVLKVYNVLGQEVATLVNETLSVGTHAVTFDAHNLASGMYFYRIQAGNFTSVKKMMLLK